MTRNRSNAVIVDARPLPRLGGNLPGTIVDPADQITAPDADRSYVSMLVLHDFAELSPSDKAEVRGALATAGYAQVSEDQGTTQGGGRVLALMIMATGALIVLLLLLAATAALNTAQADFRNLLSQLGIPPSCWSPRRAPLAGVLLCAILYARDPENRHSY